MSTNFSLSVRGDKSVRALTGVLPIVQAMGKCVRQLLETGQDIEEKSCCFFVVLIELTAEDEVAYLAESEGRHLSNGFESSRVGLDSRVGDGYPINYVRKCLQL